MNNPVFEALLEKVFDVDLNAVEYREAYKRIKNVSKGIVEALKDYLNLGYTFDDEFINDAFKDVLTREYLTGRDLAMSAQSALNKELEIALAVQEPHSAGMIEALVKEALESEFRTPTMLNAVKEIGSKAVSETARKNADFQSASGYKAYVERINDNIGLSGRKKPCPYCDGTEGTYYYPDVPPAVWGFHSGCGCKLYYYVKNKGKRIH